MVPRSAEQKKASFGFMLKYAKEQCCSVCLGLVFMLGASSGEIIVPLYIGKVIDLIQEGDFDGVGTLSAYMLILIVVSQYLR